MENLPFKLMTSLIMEMAVLEMNMCFKTCQKTLQARRKKLGVRSRVQEQKDVLCGRFVDVHTDCLQARHANKRSTKLNPKGLVYGCIIIKSCGLTNCGFPPAINQDISRTSSYDLHRVF